MMNNETMATRRRATAGDELESANWERKKARGLREDRPWLTALSIVAAAVTIVAGLTTLWVTDSKRNTAVAVDRPDTTTIRNAPHWTVDQGWDPVTQSPTVDAATKTKNYRSPDDNEVVLLVRCWQERLDIMVHWGRHEVTHPQNVVFRLGSQTPRTGQWGSSRTGHGTYVPQNDVLETIRSLARGEDFVVEIAPRGEATVTAMFELMELQTRPVMELVARQCNRLL